MKKSKVKPDGQPQLCTLNLQLHLYPLHLLCSRINASPSKKTSDKKKTQSKNHFFVFLAPYFFFFPSHLACFSSRFYAPFLCNAARVHNFFTCFFYDSLCVWHQQQRQQRRHHKIQCIGYDFLWRSENSPPVSHTPSPHLFSFLFHNSRATRHHHLMLCYTTAYVFSNKTAHVKMQLAARRSHI